MIEKKEKTHLPKGDSVHERTHSVVPTEKKSIAESGAEINFYRGMRANLDFLEEEDAGFVDLGLTLLKGKVSL